jgi:UDP-N-acetyl-D-mannosaminuronate dehydrogenase
MNTSQLTIRNYSLEFNVNYGLLNSIGGTHDLKCSPELYFLIKYMLENKGKKKHRNQITVLGVTFTRSCQDLQ